MSRDKRADKFRAKTAQVEGKVEGKVDGKVEEESDPVELAAGQVYENVVVPNRPINRLGLRPGAVLKPIVLQKAYGDGRWMAGFVGETGTHIDVDAEMLATGRLRA